MFLLKNENKGEEQQLVLFKKLFTKRQQNDVLKLCQKIIWSLFVRKGRYYYYVYFNKFRICSAYL